MDDNMLIYEVVKRYIKDLLIEYLNIGNVKHSLEYRVLYHIYYSYLVDGIGMYGDYLFKLLKSKIDKKNKRKYFNNVLSKLALLGLVKISKMDGLVFLEPSQAHIDNIINLIKKLQKSNEDFLKSISKLEKAKPSDILKYARNMFKENITIDYEEMVKLKELFCLYCRRTEDLFLFFKKIGLEVDKDDLVDNDIYKLDNNKFLVINYLTRFDKVGSYKKKLKDLIKKATERWDYAFFITLTLKRDKKLLDVNEEIRKSWDKLRAYFCKILGTDWAYIKIHEFHSDGYPHLHILVFANRKWLISQKKLSAIWEKYGMGKIVYIYLLRKEGDTYVWYRNRPKDAKDNNIDSYLTKYLSKASSNLYELAIYWLTKIRFFTYSIGKLKLERNLKPKRWEYIGIIDTLKEYDLLGLCIAKGILKRIVKNIKYVPVRGWLTPIAGMIEKLWIG